MTPDEFLTIEQEARVVDAIRQAEKNTSGEIRVHLESFNKEKPSIQHAWEVFEAIGMHKTQLRNGVLFYIDVNHRVFTIIGDEGINNVVPDNFWDYIKNKVVTQFAKGHYADALVEGILEVGKKLKKYFPYQDNDLNELPDEISKN